MCQLCDLGMTVFAAAAAVAPSVFGAASRGSTSSKLPPRSEFIIKNAYIFTIDDKLGEIENGSIHVRGNSIAGVGPNIEAPNAKIIDGRGMIVLPGLVDSH